MYCECGRITNKRFPAPDPEHRDLVNNVINQNKEIGMAATLLMEISQDEQEQARFRSRRIFETDLESDKLSERMNGMLEERTKNARTMLADGVDVNAVAKWTGLTVDEVLRLK